MENIYQELENAVLPKMTDYQTDLTKHDKNWIENNPGTKFIHFSGNTGTSIIGLISAEVYPKDGEQVRYLFGRAGRDHILGEALEMAQYHDKNRYYAKRVHYFDGKGLKRINHKQAIEIARNYIHRIREEWKVR